MAFFLLLVLFHEGVATTLPSDIAIAVVTSSPVHSSRLPTLSWLIDARARCARVLVVSDVDDKEYGTISCPCSASHWGIPCKSACAFLTLGEAVREAKWYVRVMDDTFVDIDSLAWHLSQLESDEDDESKIPLYVGEMIRVIPFHFEAALGGAGWALNQPALNLAVNHIDLYHTLTWTMGCNYTETGGQLCVGPAWPLPDAHRGRPIVAAGRGLKLQSPFADDIMWGTFMAALNISTAGPAGFTQAPVDAFDGVPLCQDGNSKDANAAQRETVELDDQQQCGRIHSLGVVYSDELVSSIGQAYGIGSCRRDSRVRPAIIHLGDEIGSMPSRVWRDQFPALAGAMASSESLVAKYNSAPYHYWSLCTKNTSSVRDRVPPNSHEHPDSLQLKLNVDTSERILAVDVCDDPESRARHWCVDAGAGTTPCVKSVTNLVAQAKDVLARHHRPARRQLSLGDGSVVDVAIKVGDSPSNVAASYCRLWNIASGDCAELKHILRASLPSHAQGWCE